MEIVDLWPSWCPLRLNLDTDLDGGLIKTKYVSGRTLGRTYYDYPTKKYSGTVMADPEQLSNFSQIKTFMEWLSLGHPIWIEDTDATCRETTFVGVGDGTKEWFFVPRVPPYTLLIDGKQTSGVAIESADVLSENQDTSIGVSLFDKNLWSASLFSNYGLRNFLWKNSAYMDSALGLVPILYSFDVTSTVLNTGELYFIVYVKNVICDSIYLDAAFYDSGGSSVGSGNLSITSDGWNTGVVTVPATSSTCRVTITLNPRVSDGVGYANFVGFSMMPFSTDKFYILGAIPGSFVHIPSINDGQIIEATSYIDNPQKRFVKVQATSIKFTRRPSGLSTYKLVLEEV